ILELKFDRYKYFVGLVRYLFIGCANNYAYTKCIKVDNYRPFKKYIIFGTKFIKRACTNCFYKGEGTNYSLYRGILDFFLINIL
ncbi:hypothetical protein QR685DRAFT_435692, partial [Neurospora intermedia]